MKIYVAIRHSIAYYDEYEEEEILAVCETRKTAIEKVIEDMERRHISKQSLSLYKAFFYNGDDEVNIWEIMPIETQ